MKSDVIQRLELSPEDFDALPVTLDVRGVDYLELRAGEPDDKPSLDEVGAHEMYADPEEGDATD